MTLQRLALSNIKGLRRKYAAFLLSSTLAVVLFYLLASFVIHPDVVSGYVAQAARVRQGLLVSQWIIVLFSFFFVMYSSSAFLRARKREFGLLSLLGATKAQLSKMLITEHIIIGTASVTVGLVAAIPLSKLMLDAMSGMLQISSPVRFTVVMPAVGLTAVLFIALFVVTGSLTALQISPRRVIRLLREHQRPKAFPLYSPWVAFISLVLIGVGYAVAWVVNGHNLNSAMLPVTAIVSLGTFLFFAQASVGILRMLQNRVSFLFRGLNLLTVGDLVFRMKENAWVLATVAVLSAAVITATGTIYTAQDTLLRDEERAYPHAVTLAVKGEADPSALASDIHRALEDDEVTVTEEVALSGLSAAIGGLEDGLVISERDFNDWARLSGWKRVSLDGTKAAMLLPLEGATAEYGIERFPMEIARNGDTYEMDATVWPFPHVNHLFSVGQFMVVDDAFFGRLAAGASNKDRVIFLSYELDDWKEHLDTSDHIRSATTGYEVMEFESRLDGYESRKQTTSLTAMIALFVTALFFVGSGSILYFRLFNEVEEDRGKYKMMEKLGVSKQEIRQVVTRQLLVFFFAPITVGALHCGFAMKALSNVLRGMPWPFLGVSRYALASVAGFSMVQVVYFLAARRAYIRETSEGAGA